MHRKIKIAQVITRMDWGGSPDLLRIICQNLDPQIYELRIFIGLTSHPSVKTEAFLQSFEERITVIPELQRDIRVWKDWFAFWRLYRIFKKEKFDILHTHTAKAGAVGRLAGRLAGIPVVIHTPHGHNFYGYFNGFITRIIVLIERGLAVLTDKIIALTVLERSDYLKFGVAENEKIALVYTGLELDDFLPKDPEGLKAGLDINKEDKVVGYVGRLDSVKGAQFFVEAARICLLENPAMRFILIGEGELRSCLEKKVSSWGLKDKVRFLGWREDVADLMSIMDILVLPSLNEAVGIVLIEAQSLGVPVVASNVGGIPEIVKDKQTGILVRPGDPQEIAGAVNGLLSDPRKMQEMSAAARSWVRGKFKAGDMVRAISDIYQEALEEKNGGS